MNKRAVIVLGIAIILIGALSYANIQSHKIPQNDPLETGNTAGNLYNKGLFCEEDGVVYFNNPYDEEGCLYSMSPDETNLKRLLNNNVNYLNAAGKYLYYYQSSSNASSALGFGGHMVGVYRCKKNGTNVHCLKKEPSGTVTLVGNAVYYEHYNDEEGMTLYKSATDGSSTIQIADYIIDPSSVQDGNIYFAGTQDNHYLYRLDTSTDTISTVYDGKIWNPIAYNEFVYYMNVEDDYKLYRYEISTGEVQKLTDDRVDTYNITGNYIYYQKNGVDDCALKRMRLDGSESEIVASGNYQNINATSRYVYFTEYDQRVPIYRTPVDGAVDVQNFEPAVAD